jgi:ribosome-binding factor A
MAYRPERLAQELKNELSVIIARELHDPRVGFATVTSVKVSPDLRYARVFISVLNTAEKKPTIEALRRATGFVRRQISARLRLRISPEIVFALDESVERGDQMTRLIAEVVRDLPPLESTEAENHEATGPVNCSLPATINLHSPPESDSADQAALHAGRNLSGDPAD